MDDPKKLVLGVAVAAVCFAGVVVSQRCPAPGPVAVPSGASIVAPAESPPLEVPGRAAAPVQSSLTPAAPAAPAAEKPVSHMVGYASPDDAPSTPRPSSIAEVSAAPGLEGPEADGGTLTRYEPIVSRAPTAEDLSETESGGTVPIPRLVPTGSVSGMTELRTGPDGRRYLSLRSGGSAFTRARVDAAPVSAFGQQQEEAPSSGGRPGLTIRRAQARSRGGRSGTMGQAMTGFSTQGTQAAPGAAPCPTCGGQSSRFGTQAAAAVRSNIFSVRAVGRCGEGYLYEISNRSGRDLGPVTLTSGANEAWDVSDMRAGGNSVIMSRTPITSLQGRVRRSSMGSAN
jgi:hypothetical protein